MRESEERMLYAGREGVLRGLAFQEALIQKLTAISLTLLLLFAICFVGLLFSFFREETPAYFAVNEQMQILPLYPLSEPMFTDAALTSWAAQTAVSIFTLDFLHWREQIAALRSCFTRKAYLSFRKSLKDEGHLAILSQYRALMHGGTLGVPVIVASGLLDQCMTWEVEIPFALSYETSERVLSEQRFVLSMRIQRVSTAEYVKGIAISQLVVAKESRLREDGQTH